MPFNKKRSYLIRIATTVLLFVLLLSGCKKDSISGKGFRFPLASEPRQIDPQVSTDSASVTMVAALFEGLACLDESGNAQPAAANWAVSGDGLTYTFTLIDSKWSDGTAVTAQDYIFGMQRAVLPSTQSTLAEQLFDIKNAQQVNAGTLDVSKLGIKAIDDKRLIITLTRPNSDFPAKTASTPFMPCKQSFFESTEGHYGLDKEYILTNGAFYLKAWNHNQSILLYKNEGYHDNENVLPAAVRYMIGDMEDPVISLSEGLLDAAPIPVESLNKAKEADLTLVTQKDSVKMIWLNNSNEALANTSVRRALSEALEWELLYKQLNSTIDIPATGFISPDSTVNSGEKYRTENNAKTPSARSKDTVNDLSKGLKQAGLDKMPAITLICADDEYNTNIARYIIQSWQKNLSLYFSIEPVSSSELAARVKVGNYQIALYSFTASSSGAIDALGNFKTGAIGNYSHFSDKNYDSKLSAADSTATRSRLEALEAILWESCPSIPLSFEMRYVGIPKGNSGIIVRSFGGGAFGAPYDFIKAGKKDD